MNGFSTLLNHQNRSHYYEQPDFDYVHILRTSSTKSGEEITEHYEIDQSIIDEEEKYDGFYAIATNLDDHAKDIIEISANRYKIDDYFCVSFSMLSEESRKQIENDYCFLVPLQNYPKHL